MQFNVAVLIYCAALFQGAICAIRRDCECGIGNEEEIDTRIINGIVTYPHQYPWMVYLKYMGRVFCGGAILNDRYVITAGHCLYDMQPQYMQIVVGGHDSEVEDGITVDVEALKLHENYTRYAAYDDNDIGIIKLSKTLHLNNNINPICLPNPASDYTRAKVVIAGWGITEKKQMSRYLLHNSVRILSQSDCKNANRIGSKFRVLENLCAYGHATDTCQGDSGSPLVYESSPFKFELAGIVSWGEGCAPKNTPSVYVRVTHYLPWIERHSRDGHYCLAQRN